MTRTYNCRKEMTSHLRAKIAEAGIAARVRQSPGCGDTGIQVFPPACGVSFSEDEQRIIRTLAVANHLTSVRGLPIDIERMTDAHGMEFHLSAEGIERWRELVARMPNIHVAVRVRAAA